MRWNVEMTAIDKTESQTVVVEAESWQRALQAARAQRGESGPISGFSIELLDEGYRAVDPMARLRYTVKRAPEGTPISPSVAPKANAGEAKAPSVFPPAPSGGPPRPGPSPDKASEKAADKAEKANEKSGVQAQAPKPGVPKPGPDKTGPEKTGSEKPGDIKGASPTTSGPPKPVTSVAPAAAAASSPSKRPAPAAPVRNVGGGAAMESVVAPTQTADADATIRTNALDEMPTVPSAFIPSGAIGPLPAAGAPAAAPHAEPVPATQVIFKREHDPSDKVPLTYREYVYAVARGVDESSAERLLRAQLENVKTSILHAKPGKFVNMAVFDVVFQGRPPVPPLATLAWKDWKGAPQVAFPRRPTHAPSPVQGSPPAAQEAAPIVPVPVQLVASAPPVPAPPPIAPAPVVAPAPPAPTSARDPFAPGTAPLPPGVAPPPAFSPASQPPPPMAAQPAPPPVAPPVPHVPPPAPAAVSAPPTRVPSSPKHLAANATGPHRLTPTPSRPALRSLSGGRRASGDELIADLFEAMHELHFFPDAIDAGDFVLRLAMEMIPSRAALVHLYDINTREFVIACALGAQTHQLLLKRHGESEPLLAWAMRNRRAVVLASTADSDALSAERFNLLGGAKSLIVSPVMKGGRFLGVLEVMNPNDGQPYTAHEGNALDYISEQFAEFLAERGVVVDADRITRHPAAH